MIEFIVQSNVWCSNQQNEDLGLDSEDSWCPISIDFRKVVAIKEAGPNDFIGHNKSVIYVNNEHFIIDIIYTKSVMMWISILSQNT